MRPSPLGLAASLVPALLATPAVGLQLTQITFFPNSPPYEAYESQPAWSPDGAWITLASASWSGQPGGEPYFSIRIVSPSGAAGPPFQPDAWIQYHPTWSHDGTHIAWADGGSLLLAPVASYFDWQRIVFGGVRTPSWSPVENRIAFERNGTLAVVAATGGSPTSLPASGGHNPSWSHDASKLAYDAGGRIWILDLALSSSTPITSGSTTDMHPTWSPSGDWIAFASRRSGSSALWVVSTSGGAPIQLTSGATSDSDPAWSPDGNSIAFTSERGGAGPHLWIASDLPDFTVAVEAETWTGLKQLYRAR